MSDALRTLLASAKEVRSHNELFHTKILTYNDWLKKNIHEGFAALLRKLRDTTRELVRQRHLGSKKTVDVEFSVVNEMFKALEVDFRHPGLGLIPVD